MCYAVFVGDWAGIPIYFKKVSVASPSRYTLLYFIIQDYIVPWSGFLLYVTLYYALFYEGGSGIPISFKRVDLASPFPYDILHNTLLLYTIMYYAMLQYILFYEGGGGIPISIKTAGGGILFSTTPCHTILQYTIISLRAYMLHYIMLSVMKVKMASTSL